ncbi:MAG: hypothetical protein HY700_12150, partial [Gemmatimonadetes bacterium]|nr:hypothetical protein [Gemmatimonadota bacterium]
PAPEPMRPMSLEEELAAHVPPPGPPVAPPPPPQFWPEPAPPPAPPYTPPPAPIAELPLDLSPPLPPSPRETKEINLRASQAMHREEVEELERPRPRVSRPRVSMPVAQPPRPPSAARAFLLILVLVVAALGALAYFGILPVGGWLDQVKSTISTRAATSSDGTAGRAGSAASPASPGAARGAPTEAPPPGPGAPRIAGARVPPVRIEGLPVESFTESGDRFRVLQRRPSGETLTLLGRPLADTIGEPSVGDIRLDSLPGDTAVATTAFGGYVITVRGVIAPADLQALLLQLVSRTN